MYGHRREVAALAKQSCRGLRNTQQRTAVVALIGPSRQQMRKAFRSTRGLGHSRLSRGSVSGYLSQALANWPAKASARVAANPSIEGTSTSGLRPLAAAPHVKR